MAVPPPAFPDAAVASGSVLADKAALRERMRAVRLAFPPSPIPVHPEFASRLRGGLVVASYRPMAGEADPAPLADAARAAGCVLVLPRVTRRTEPMRFLRWGTTLERGVFGIEQPPADAEELAPDIVLTPLVAFDRRGARLGQGAGYYDAAFARYPAAWRVGVAWSAQEGDVPVDLWDAPLHAVATEREWITT